MSSSAPLPESRPAAVDATPASPPPARPGSRPGPHSDARPSTRPGTRPSARPGRRPGRPARGSGDGSARAPRLAGLDGLRALAVAAVIAYHVDPGWLPGGYLGVDVFFGISGFLITHLLVAEHRRDGRIGLGGFWRRRAVRLLPELLLVLAACALTARLIAGRGTGIGDGLRGDTLASLGFVNNWWQVHQGADYFHHFGSPPLLQHLWSLSVEEQFYLAWPLLLAALLPLARGRRRLWPAGLLAVLAAGGAAASLWRMQELGPGATGGSRAYFGTDSHCGALLAGCAAALALPALTRASARLPRRGRAVVRTALAVLACFAVLGPGNGVMYRWGFAVVAVSTAAVCAGCAAGAAPRLLDTAPLRLLGRHSYGLYLWHWPVVVTVNALWPDTTAAVRAVELLAPLPLAVAGGRLVQRPLAGALRHRAGAATGADRTAGRRRALPVLIGAAVLAAAAVLVSPVSAPSALQSQLQAGARYEATLAGKGGDAHFAPPHGTSGTAKDPVPPPPAATPTSPSAAPSLAPGAVDGSDITMIGDSITLGSAQDLHRVLPGIELYAQVGRMMEQAPGICAQLLAQHRLRGTVVLALGTNATFSAEDVDHVRDVVGDRRLVLTTVRGPFAWQDSVNAAARDYHSRHPEVLLDDWYSTVASHLNLLWIDHIHPRGGAGTTLFATSLADTLTASGS